MTMLSDRDILKALAAGRLRIDGLDPDGVAIQPASVDLCLDCVIRPLRDPLFRSDILDPAVDSARLFSRVERPADGSEPFELPPHGFALADTYETVTVPDDLAVRVEGCSSVARLGVMVHAAGFVDPGFAGHITLELSNMTALPVRLWPGMKIAQVCIFRLSSPAERPYGSNGLNSHYQGQRGPTTSRSFQNFRRGLPEAVTDRG